MTVMLVVRAPPLPPTMPQTAPLPRTRALPAGSSFGPPTPPLVSCPLQSEHLSNPELVISPSVKSPVPQLSSEHDLRGARLSLRPAPLRSLLSHPRHPAPGPRVQHVTSHLPQGLPSAWTVPSPSPLCWPPPPRKLVHSSSPRTCIIARAAVLKLAFPLTFPPRSHSMPCLWTGLWPVASQARASTVLRGHCPISQHGPPEALASQPLWSAHLLPDMTYVLYVYYQVYFSWQLYDSVHPSVLAGGRNHTNYSNREFNC